MTNPKVEDLSGKVFGRWTVIRRASSNSKGDARFLCRCCCGNEREVLAFSLRNGKSTTCRDCRTIHAGWGEPEHAAWNQAMQRCHNNKNPGFKDYGGRGIKVCDEWRSSFHAFISYIGPKPSPAHSLDRYPDNDGNYEPGNVRWATAKEQANNTRRSRPKTQDCNHA